MRGRGTRVEGRGERAERERRKGEEEGDEGGEGGVHPHRSDMSSRRAWTPMP